MNIVKSRKKIEIKRTNQSPKEFARFTKIRFSKSMVHFQLKDGRLISVPLNDIEFLKKMKPTERKEYKIEGSAAFWDLLMKEFLQDICSQAIIGKIYLKL